MSLSEAKSQLRSILTVRYPADLEYSLVVAPDELSSIVVLAGDLEGVSDWD